MKAKVEITYSFREDLVGDTADNDSFYLKVTPVVKIKKVADATPTREDMKKIANAVLQEIKQKRIKV